MLKDECWVGYVDSLIELLKMIHVAIADKEIALTLSNKGMYNHSADLCKHWNTVVDICNGRKTTENEPGDHTPENGRERQKNLLDILAWFEDWKKLHDQRVVGEEANEYNFLPMRLGFAFAL